MKSLHVKGVFKRYFALSDKFNNLNMSSLLVQGACPKEEYLPWMLVYNQIYIGDLLTIEKLNNL